MGVTDATALNTLERVIKRSRNTVAPSSSAASTGQPPGMLRKTGFVEGGRIYGMRFKIEVTFKRADHSVGAWSCHFRMAGMKPLKRRSGNPYVHMETDHYRRFMRRKLGACRCILQMGVLAQGLLRMLAMLYPNTTWRRFRSGLHTIRPGVAPSEDAVALAPRESLPEPIAGFRETKPLAEIISKILDVDSAEGFRLAS